MQVNNVWLKYFENGSKSLGGVKNSCTADLTRLALRRPLQVLLPLAENGANDATASILWQVLALNG